MKDEPATRPQCGYASRGRGLASTISDERVATAASVLVDIRGRLEASLNEAKARIVDDGEDVA